METRVRVRLCQNGLVTIRKFVFIKINAAQRSARLVIIRIRIISILFRQLEKISPAEPIKRVWI